VSLRFSDGGSTNPPSVAYAIGRRVGSAVDRNRIRRRLRASVAACADDLDAGGAYLFDAERAVLTLGFTDLCAAVASLVRRAAETRR
jgi:ribonuclease P protein component